MIRGIAAVPLTDGLIDKETCLLEEVNRYRNLLTDQDVVLKRMSHKSVFVHVMLVQEQLYTGALAICINDTGFFVCSHTDCFSSWMLPANGSA